MPDSRDEGWYQVKEPDDQQWHRVYLRKTDSGIVWGYDEQDDPEILHLDALIKHVHGGKRDNRKKRDNDRRGGVRIASPGKKLGRPRH